MATLGTDGFNSMRGSKTMKHQLKALQQNRAGGSGLCVPLLSGAVSPTDLSTALPQTTDFTRTINKFEAMSPSMLYKQTQM